MKTCPAKVGSTLISVPAGNIDQTWISLAGQTAEATVLNCSSAGSRLIADARSGGISAMICT
jgi:hypothetical protein